MVKTPMIRIYDVSLKQQKLLDEIWTFDTEPELNRWIKSLNSKKAKKVRLLKTMIELAAIDEFVSNMEDYPHAQTIIDDIFVIE